MKNLADRGLRSAAELAADKPCGTRLRYVGGCRCFKCRRANSDYERARQVARKAGDWNGIVPADRARAHLRALSRNGIGRRTVADAAGVALSVVMAIRNGSKTHIRARTERKILAVDRTCRPDSAHVSAGRTWQLIDSLVEEGYSKAELARRMGYREPALQIGRDLVTVRTAHRVEVLHRRLTT